MRSKRRLDLELVERGFFETQHEAQRAVMAGLVHDESSQLTKAGMQISPDHHLSVKGKQAFVSRGGHKLKGALSSFEVDPHGLRALDVGCSTGGFTDCLLQQGCAHVCALDVGSAQFSWGLRNDERVTLFERTNIKDVSADQIGGPFDLIVCDVSFISILPLLNQFAQLLTDTGALVTLVKPQFEAERDEVGTGGVIRDPHIHRLVLRKIVHGFLESPLTLHDLCVSSIKGPKGNREFFAYATRKDATRKNATGLPGDGSRVQGGSALGDKTGQSWDVRIDEVVTQAWKDEQ